MSDRIAVMDAGRIVQLGTGEELYERPRTRFVAQFLGGCNLLGASASPGSPVARTALGDLQLPTAGTRPTCTLAIRPEKIRLGATGAANTFPGEVLETVYTGAETHCRVQVGQEILRAISVNTAGAPRFAPGQSIAVTLPPEALVVLED
jgi:ABC-type Fe3+/spermidine/putrescine transport system ATPase subunit